MGIFSRFSDIISSNINAMLDKAENPEKMIRLMIREMEETLVELKANCAGTMADRTKAQRDLDEVASRVAKWENRAELAVAKGREDLAREALQEKLRWQHRAEELDQELLGFDSLVDQCRDDIERLEEKLNGAKEKQRFLVQRHIRADTKKRAQKDLRKAGSADAVRRFEEYEQRIERLEAEAELSGPPSQRSLEQEFQLLEGDDDIVQELEKIKAKKSGGQAKKAESAKTGDKDGK